MKRKAQAHWEGSIKEGKGHISLQSRLLTEAKYSVATRFGEEPGTNPEELIAAAHAGCFTMKLSAVLTENGTPPEHIDTQATVGMEDGAIHHIALTTTAKVAGLDAEKFRTLAEDAKTNCPISKLFNAEISLEANLV